MKIQKTQPNLHAKSKITFQKKAIIEGPGLENLVANMGKRKANEFVKKVSTSIKGISKVHEEAVLKFDETTISGNKVILRGKYVDNHSVEDISIALNKKATAHKTHRKLTRFFERFKPTNIFYS